MLNTLKDGAILLDVRSKEDYEISHIQGSLSFPLEELEQATLDWDKNQLIYVHCQLGKRSLLAKDILEQGGFTNVKNLGGLDEVLALGLPLAD